MLGREVADAYALDFAAAQSVDKDRRHEQPPTTYPAALSET